MPAFPFLVRLFLLIVIGQIPALLPTSAQATTWNLRADKSLPAAGGWNVYWSSDNGIMASRHACLAEQVQPRGTHVILGVGEMGSGAFPSRSLKDRQLILTFRHETMGNAPKDCHDCAGGKTEHLVFLIDGRSELPLRFEAQVHSGKLFLTRSVDLGESSFLFAPGKSSPAGRMVPVGRRPFEETIASSNRIRITRARDGAFVANIDLKGSAAALKAVNECLDARHGDFLELMRASTLKDQARVLVDDAQSEGRSGEVSEAGQQRIRQRYQDAEAKLREVVATYERLLGSDHPDLGRVLESLNLVLKLKDKSGSIVAALEQQEMSGKALAIREKAAGKDDPATANQLIDQAVALVSTGAYVEASRLFDRWLSIVERELSPTDYRPGFEGGNAHPDFEHGFLFMEGLQFGVSRTGDRQTHSARYKLIEPLLLRKIAILEAKLGLEDMRLVRPLENLSYFYAKTDDLEQAERVMRRALAIRQKTRGGDHREVAEGLSALATILAEAGKTDEALHVSNQALAMLDRMPIDDGNEQTAASARREAAAIFGTLARISLAKGNVDEAIAALRRELAWREVDPIYKIARDRLLLLTRTKLASALLRKGDAGEALDLARMVAAAERPDRLIHLAALHGASSDANLRESFEAVQGFVSSKAGSALSSLAARAATGDDDLAALVRSEQDLNEEVAELERAIMIDGLSIENADGGETRRRLRDASAELARQRERLRREFPDYSELSKPGIVPLEETQRLLADDEALIVLDTLEKGEGGEFVWALTRTQARWDRVEAGEGEVARMVATLREGLDRLANGGAPIDPGLAHRLYAKLLGPVENVFGGKKHLIFVLNGPVSSLPPQVLAVEPPAGAGLAGVDWLARHFAVTVMPTVSSLKLLRESPVGARAPRPFRGYGDPVFDTDREDGAARMAQRGYRAFFGTRLANVDMLRSALPRLPGTGVELKAVATSLGVPQSEILLRKAATEAAVKGDSLDRYEILYFATHGLVAGEVGQLAEGGAEPALALTVPKEATTLDDGLLTASEIAQLKLNADWVVLSACNTAAEGEPGADALSGLARAFFYAGARSLLVSHWVVDDLATAELMQRTFANAARRQVRAAEALRLAMLSVIDDPANPQWADPVFWAPFIIVGEPRLR